MREIKFRVWDYDKMRYDVTGLKCNNGLVEGFYLDDIYAFGHIMQYTGINDKNGKEIYEGDILEYNNIKYQVKWSNNFMFILTANKIGGGMLCEYSMENMEIIGNIFENPELLEE